VTDFIFTQIFKAHKWLWIADSFSRHQLEHQKLRKRPDKTWLDHEEVHANRFRFLLPHILSEADLNTKYRCEHDELLERLVDIENTYNVFKRSIDFDVKLGNSLKYVLVKPRKPGPRRDLLSAEQYEHVANIISSIDQWEDELESVCDGPSLWTTIYQAQSEIYKTGQVSQESRTALESLNAAKPKRKKTYARPLLALLLAEFFDDFSSDGIETNISDRSLPEEYDAKSAEITQHAQAFFDSPFARFVANFHEFIQAGESPTLPDSAMSEYEALANAEAERVALQCDEDWPILHEAIAYFAGQDEFDEKVHEWRVEKRKESLGYERSILNARKSKETPRVSEMVLTGGSLSELSEVLTILDAVKPPKKKKN